MSSNPSKQSKSSRKSKSPGPKSKAGKQQSAQNAVKDGAFSRGIVIERLGERRADFEHAKQMFWGFFQPSNPLEEMLVSDFVENWWRRERVRRAEEEELHNRLKLDQIKNDLKRSDEVEELRLRFAVLFESYSAINVMHQRPQDIPPELQDVLSQLASTALGIDFLILLAKMIASSVEHTEILTQRDRALLGLILGHGNEGTSAALVMYPASEIRSQLSEQRAQESAKHRNSKHQTPAVPSPSPLSAIAESKSIAESDKKDQKQAIPSADESGSKAGAVDSDPSPASISESKPPAESDKKPSEKATRWKDELRSQIDKTRVEIVLHQLNERKRKLDEIDQGERANLMATAIVDPKIFERFSRAETQAERRMYRALAALTAMRSQSIPNLLPAAKPKLHAEPEQPPSKPGT